MPTLKIDLTADSRKMEGQMQSAGRSAAAKFSQTFDTNSKVGQSLLKRLSAAGNSAGRALAEAFGAAGIAAGTQFGKEFKKSSGAISGAVAGAIAGGIGGKAAAGGISKALSGGANLANLAKLEAQLTEQLKQATGNPNAKVNVTSDPEEFARMSKGMRYVQKRSPFTGQMEPAAPQGMLNKLKYFMSGEWVTQYKKPPLMERLNKTIIDTFGLAGTKYGQLKKRFNKFLDGGWLIEMGAGPKDMSKRSIWRTLGKMGGEGLQGADAAVGRAASSAIGGAVGTMKKQFTIGSGFFDKPSLKALGLVTAMGILIKKTLDLADRFEQMAKKTGYNVQSIQALVLSAQRVGGTGEEPAAMQGAALAAQERALQNATGPEMMAFQRLGIDREKLRKSQNPLELLAQNVKPGKQAEISLGRIIPPEMVPLFKELQPVLKDISATVANMTKEGDLMNPEDVLVIDEAKQAFADMIQGLQTDLMPVLAAFAMAIMELVYNVGDGIKWLMYVLAGNLDGFQKLGSAIVDLFADMLNNIKDLATNTAKFMWAIVKDPSILFSAEKMAQFATKGTEDSADKVYAAGSSIIDNFGRIMDEANEYVAESQNQRAQRAASRRIIAGKRPNAGTRLNPVDVTGQMQEAAKSAMRMPSDEHVSIGNFLGQGTSLSSIGQKQVELQQQMLSALQNIAFFNAQQAALAKNNMAVGIPQ